MAQERAVQSQGHLEDSSLALLVKEASSSEMASSHMAVTPWFLDYLVGSFKI